ncbi:MAG: pyruvate kinase [Parabacteroides sp.]|jgi:pyruvate kinase|uniref:Pyruvate kinase n=1 Tax=Macellibacteroides fermentans TaxID=879969 RepID=A0A8E2D978_9PORP|nr:pyruvate kinase [Macellibacteroides fermentans]MDD3508257.1 pyruvate kinase [Parabacteroides sp.]NYI51084.1 pyruvate kinase [Macellibacteroides fermentans]HAD01593.1 pyruvate kinase [Porphyromonadaceae bacterium]HRG12312.1 pyruvate kinase [Macellibacteroides fermentans]
MLKHTKIVATVSDQRCEVEFIRSLYKAGMNVVRLNSAHMVEEGFNRVVGNTRAVSNHIALLMDTKGPEIRTTKTAQPLELKTGDRIKVMGNPDGETTRECICLSYKNFVADMSVGGELLIDDGDLDLKVIEKHSDYLVCEALNDATLGSRKSVNVPGVRISLPSLTEKDRTSILYCIKNNLDFIAHSFVRCKQDVLDIQRILDEHNSPIKIIAKIENQEGIDNIDEILEVAYGIMIARGDLGIEVPQEKIPGIQRVLIRKCVEAKKPVIVATQMLHSMINNPRPTRAEVTDIANAIYYRTDALMLSGETAYGKYPVEAVATMTKIAAEAEKTKLAANDIRVPIVGNDLDVTSFLAKQAVKASSKLHVKAIITDSFTGRTARYLAAFRGTSTVYAICYHERLTRELALSYGVWAVYQEESKSEREYYFKALNELIKSGRITRSDMVAYLSGSFGEGGGTSFLEINNVGKVLDAGDKYSLPTFKD